MIVFFLGRLTGNPLDLMLPEDATAEDRAALARTLGLDGSTVRPARHLRQERAAGRSRNSIRMKQPAVEAFDRLPNTLLLIPWAIPARHGARHPARRGGGAQSRQHARLRVAGTVAVLGIAMPSFCSALLIFVFSVELGWLPSGRMGGPDTLR